jgi:hypothetical protein
MNHYPHLIAMMCLTTASVGSAMAKDADQQVINPAPRARDWAAIAKWPDWSGTWTPAPDDRAFPLGRNEPKWLPDVARQVQQLKDDDAAGTPRNVYVNCLP